MASLFKHGIITCASSQPCTHNASLKLASFSTHGIITSTSSQPCVHDVFLSFRGEDTRLNFISHLHKSLVMKGISTFIDFNLTKGGEISPFLMEAIENSMISIVVFSRNYASSSWCLDELVKIHECNKSRGQTLFPVFYHVEPSNVRKQNNSYGEALAKHEEKLGKDSEKLQAWKGALTEIAKLNGFHLQENQTEANLIDKIVEAVFQIKVKRTPFYAAKYPVGIAFRVKEIEDLLDIGRKDVRIVGIYGMGGIGKTTLAAALLDKFSNHFDACCFLQDVRRKSKDPKGLENIQQEMLLQIFNDKDLMVPSRKGIYIISQRIGSKRVMLILDDVDKQVQLEYLVGHLQRFHLESRIIVTTRDQKLLKSCGYDAIPYILQGLNNCCALELFSWHAFQTPHPKEEFLKLSERAISYAKGLPLAIEVLGCLLASKDGEHEWKVALDQLDEIPDDGINEVLKISFDGLSSNQKEIFLDLVCFFTGSYHPYSEELLTAIFKVSGYGKHPSSEMKVLQEKSLIHLNGSDINIHSLIEEMGKDMARKEAKNLGKCKRVFDYEDARQLLTENIGTNEVEGIKLQLPKFEVIEEIDANVFEKMKRLKYLFVKHARITTDMEYLPTNIRVIEWDNFASSSFPCNFNPRNLVYLSMSVGSIERLWVGQKNLNCLRIVEMFNCHSFIEVPDFSTAQNLEVLKLFRTGALEIHESVGSLPRLRELEIEDCFSLMRLPSCLKTPSLELLTLIGCPKVKEFPEVAPDMKCTDSIMIFLKSVGVKELPASFENLAGLASLCIEDCKNFKIVANSIYSMEKLEYFEVSKCFRFVGFPKLEAKSKKNFENIYSAAEVASPSSGSCPGLSLSSQKFCKASFLKLVNLRLAYCNISDAGFLEHLDRCSLKYLDLSGNQFPSLPSCVSEFKNLRILHLDECKFLCEIPLLQSRLPVYATGCESLNSYEVVIIDKEQFMEDFREYICADTVEDFSLDSTVDFSAVGASWERVKEVNVRVDNLRRGKLTITLSAKLLDEGVISSPSFEFLDSGRVMVTCGHLEKLPCRKWIVQGFFFSEHERISIKRFFSDEGDIMALTINVEIKGWRRKYSRRRR